MTLHALKLDGSMSDTVLTTGLRALSGYDVSGDNVVWGGFGPEAKVYLYNLQSGQRKEISGSGAFTPLINGNKVVWTEEPSGGLTGGIPTDWSIKLYNIATGAQSLVRKEHADWASATALTRQGSIVYVKGSVYRELYLIPTPQPIVQDLSALSMVSPTEGWAVGAGGAILHYQ
jgi:hypothetical protein